MDTRLLGDAPIHHQGGRIMALYKMSDLAPLAMAEINEIIRLAGLKEKLAAQSAGRESTTVKRKRARRTRGKQLELNLQREIRRN